MEQASEHAQVISYDNSEYINAGVIQLRLETKKLLSNLEAFFRGTEVIGWKDTNGEIKPIFGKKGTPILNDIGIQNIMSWLTSMIGSHTVQGNFEDFTDFMDFIIRIDKDLSCHVMLNRGKWDLLIENYDGMLSGICATAERFFSRSVGDKERQSYGNTLRSVENTRSERGGSFLGLRG